MTIPEGWEISNDNGIVMFKTPEYPNDPDSISLMTTVKTDSFDSLTKEDFREYFASIFSDVTINTFEKTTVDEFSAYIVEYTYKLSSIEIKHKMCIRDRPEILTLPVKPFSPLGSFIGPSSIYIPFTAAISINPFDSNRSLFHAAAYK